MKESITKICLWGQIRFGPSRFNLGIMGVPAAEHANFLVEARWETLMPARRTSALAEDTLRHNDHTTFAEPWKRELCE